MKKFFVSWKVFPHLFLVGIFFLFILLRIPSLIEPYWYGDEGIYAVIGQSMREGYVLYQDIWDNKPPVLYLLYALVNGELFWIKLLSLLVGVATIFVFYLLSRHVLQERISVIVATSVFTVLFGLPLLEGNIANAENFMLLPIATAFLIALRKKSSKSYAIAGLLLSIALMTKSVAIFDITALLFILLLNHLKKTKQIIVEVGKFIMSKDIRLLLFGIVSLPLITVIVYVFLGAVSDLISSTFTNNVQYVGFTNHLLFPLGRVFLKIGLLIAAVSLIYYFRARLTKVEYVVFPWLAFSLFSVFFSDRPYTHYLLMGLLPFSLLIGYVTQKRRLMPLIIAIGVIFVSLSYFSVYKKNIDYYHNYISYVFGGKKFQEYVAFFDRNAVLDYAVAQSMKSHINGESVYYWSDSAQLYLLTGVLPITKYIVAYHNLSYADALSLTEQQVRDHSPQYIVSTKNMDIPFKLYDRYEVKYMIDRVKIYEKSI